MNIHLIAIGGSVMHNLAISLQKAGHNITGSDDEIYDPARSRLQSHGLLPEKEGWDVSRIHAGLDVVILGMHARADNPELVEAQELGLSVQSFPEFIGQHAENKTRIVVAGSHGKTTTTSMIMHVLKDLHFDFDYLVGAQLEGFDTMVRLSDAPIMVIEGDEYLSSCLDRVPKIWHYRPHMSIITGIAWDHMNVFPTLEDYHAAFVEFLECMPEGAYVCYDAEDDQLRDLIMPYHSIHELQSYEPFESEVEGGEIRLVLKAGKVPLQIFGRHNLANLKAAWLVLRKLGVPEQQFAASIRGFAGAAKRLQTILHTEDHIFYQDFAHAPSKVKATVQAVRHLYPQRKLTACVELHTYSSLNKRFLPQYAHTMDACDVAIVFFSDHTLEMKKMPPLSQQDIESAFKRGDMIIFKEKEALESYLKSQQWGNHNLLLMSSGTFGGLNLDGLKIL